MKGTEGRINVSDSIPTGNLFKATKTNEINSSKIQNWAKSLLHLLFRRVSLLVVVFSFAADAEWTGIRKLRVVDIRRSAASILQYELNHLQYRSIDSIELNNLLLREGKGGLVQERKREREKGTSTNFGWQASVSIGCDS